MVASQIPWFWLITTGCIFAGSSRVVQLVVCEGTEQRRALHSLAGLVIGWLLFRLLMV